MTLFALHGFLGRPADWDPILSEAIKVDYLNIHELMPNQDLISWGKSFNQWALQKAPAGKRVLCAYSLGGRLAMHALMDNESLWDAAILVSANPVVPVEEREARKSSDEKWALRFLNEDFESVVRDWNKQTVFEGSVQEPARNESDYDKKVLSDIFTRWSTSGQQDLRTYLKKAKIPILWISGDKDLRYVKRAEEIKLESPHLEFRTIKNSAHRILFDQPDELQKTISSFLLSL